MERLKYKPHAIVGDLDSIRPEVKAFYDRAGSTLVEVHDQDMNDFEKSIRFVLQGNRQNGESANKAAKSEGEQGSEDRRKIVAYGAFGGRID